MKNPETKGFFSYIYNNFISNFIGFIIGMAATRLVSHFFVTRSIKNLWGLAARKTVIDKSTFNNLELFISVVIGFIVFEVFSRWMKQKIEEVYPACRATVLNWFSRNKEGALVEKI